MPVNVKITQIEEGEKALIKLVAEEAKLRKEYKVDGIDDEEQKDLNRYVGKIKTLKEVIAKLRAEIEENKRAWEARSSELATARSQLVDLVDWPFDGVTEYSNIESELDDAVADQRWKDASGHLTELQTKLSPAYIEYTKQVDAKKLYDPMAAETELRLKAANKADPLSEELTGLITDFEGEFADVQKLATDLDYVGALAVLEALLASLDDIEARIKALATQKETYDKAWMAIQPALQEASVCEFPDLLPMQEEIVAVQEQIEAAAEIHDYDTAIPLVDDLKTKLDVYMTEYGKAVDARTLYDSRFPRIESEVADATVSEFPALADQQAEITKIYDAMVAAADGGDYEAALLEMDKLPPLLDAYRLAYDQAVLGREFEELYARMEPDFAAVSVSTYGPLAPLTEEILGMQQSAQSDAAAGQYQTGIDTLTTAAQKIEEWHVLFAEIDMAKADYDRRLPDLIARFDAIASCEYPQLVDGAQMMIDARAEMEKAATEGDYVTAMMHLESLDTLVSQMTDARNTLDAKRMEYEARIGGLISRFDGLMQSDFAELEDERAALEQARADMETAASGNDFPLALDHMGVVERLLNDLDAQLGNLIDMRNQYEALYQQIRKDLAAVEGCSHAELESKKTPIMTLQGEMLGAAEATDFTLALEKAKELVPLLSEFLKLEELLKGYLSSLSVIDPKMDEVRAFTYKSMEKAKTEIIELYDDMKADAAEAKIAEAIDKMTELRKLVADALARNAELTKNEPVFDKLHADMRGKIELVRESEIEPAEKEAKAVLEAYDEMVDLGDEKDEFMEAIKKADEINKTLLPAFLKKVDEHGDDEEAFRLLEKMALEAYGKAEQKKEEYEDALSDDFDDLTDLKGEMEDLEKDEKWKDAKVKAKALLDAIKRFDAKWKEESTREASVTAAGKAAIKRFDSLPSDADDKAEDDYDDAKDLKSKLETALDDKDFDTAEDATDDLNDKVDDIEEALKTTAELIAEYEGRRDSLKPIIGQAIGSPMVDHLGDELEALQNAFDEMVRIAEKEEDYKAALSKADDVDEEFLRFEKAEMAMNTSKVKYDERMKGVADRYIEAIAVKDEELQGNIETAKKLKGEAEDAADDGNFSKAADKASELTNEVVYILKRAEELEDERAAEEECEPRGPAGEIGDKVDDIADKGKDVIDKVKDKVKDEIKDRIKDALPDPIGHGIEAIDEGLQAADHALDGIGKALDGDWDGAADDMLDAASDAFDAVAEGVQVDPRSKPFEKPIDIAKDAKDFIEDIVRD